MAEIITGTLEIRNRLNVSEATLMDMILNQGLPAKKDESGVYCISVKDLQKWQGFDDVAKPEAEKEIAKAKTAKSKK